MDRYIKIDLIDVTQKGKTFFVGKIKALDLLKIYTVRPAIYDVEKNSSLAKIYPSERDYYDDLIKTNKKTIVYPFSHLSACYCSYNDSIE
jgi:hypothetical protein